LQGTFEQSGYQVVILEKGIVSANGVDELESTRPANSAGKLAKLRWWNEQVLPDANQSRLAENRARIDVVQIE
jgi:hypothetical protein